MVRGHKDIGGVRVSRLLHQVHQFADRLVCRLKDAAFGALLVAGGVNHVVVDVQHAVVLEEFAPLVWAECLEVLGLYRGTANVFEDLLAGCGPIGRLIVGQHGFAVP